VVVNETIEILHDVYLIPKIEHRYPTPKGNRYLYVKKDSEWRFDDFSHELMLVIKEDDGLVVFTGCSHNGILNMVDTVSTMFEGVPIKAVVGGFHLIGNPMFNSMAGSKAEVEEVGRKIVSYPIETVFSGHCTGQKAYEVLDGVMGEKLFKLHTGYVIEV
jgi:7,8-dihydropterin-6-yl-methyl-4-(beta-D-ribofuranosyl)aminobenzene 5'-phosphate synthase